MNDVVHEAIDVALDRALMMVGKHGHHEPFALGVAADGHRTYVFSVKLDAADDAPTVETGKKVDSILVQVQRMVDAGTCVVVALATNVFVKFRGRNKEVAAVKVTAQAIRRSPVTIYVPYDIEKGEVRTESRIEADPEHRFFDE
jgi:hypothetical protein